MKNIKILIVDDRPENLLVLESLIDIPDVDLIRANSGPEALAKTLDYDFALVLLDVNMPDMDGYEVAELMRGNKATKNIPIIFLTAEHKEQAHIFKGYDAGAVDYLFKPLEPVILQSKVGVFLELHRQKEELDIRLQELQELQQQLEESNEQLTMLSRIDGLTGLINRRHFDELFLTEWNRSKRNKTALAILLIDIDHFKAYNDFLGHLAGDDCLKLVAQSLNSTLKRIADKSARYGGEEFVILLPETDIPGANTVAEALRQNIESLQLPHPGANVHGRVTVSIGVSATIPMNEHRPEYLIHSADLALYSAKEEGRNRCHSRHLDIPQQQTAVQSEQTELLK